MPYLIPPRTPLTEEQVERAFDYVIELQLGGGSHVAGRADADPELAFLLLRLAEDIVFPATAVSEDDDLYSDSFALDEVGCILLSALRDWARTPPPPARWASPAPSSGSRWTSSRTPMTRTPPPLWRRCGTSTGSTPAQCTAWLAPTSSRALAAPSRCPPGAASTSTRWAPPSGAHSMRCSGCARCGAFRHGPVSRGNAAGCAGVDARHRHHDAVHSGAMPCIHPESARHRRRASSGPRRVHSTAGFWPACRSGC